MHATERGRAVLPRAAWLWLIPLPLLVHIGAAMFDPNGEFFTRWIESESGIIENGTAIALLPATVMALLLAHRLRTHFGVAAVIWFLGVAAVCFGFAGEEVSWGQHWWGWESPAYFEEHNRQGETNFHNMNIHFGRVVKTILTLAIVIGGLVLPFSRRPRTPPTFADVITPLRVCVPVAAFVLGVRLIERLKTWFDLDWALLAVNLKETQELYIALFLLLYVWSIARREDLKARA